MIALLSAAVVVVVWVWMASSSGGSAATTESASTRVGSTSPATTASSASSTSSVRASAGSPSTTVAQARTAPPGSSSLLVPPPPPRGSGAPGSAPVPTLDRVGAEETTSTTPVDLPVHEAVGAEALTLISYPWRSVLPGWSVRFLPGRPGYLGGTWTETKRVEVYVREGQSVEEIAFTLAHELGHAIDVTHFGDADRKRWASVRGFDAPWWAGSGVSDYASGSGDFAESFAVWQVGGRSLSKLGGQPTAEQLAVLADLVDR